MAEESIADMVGGIFRRASRPKFCSSCEVRLEDDAVEFKDGWLCGACAKHRRKVKR